MCPISYLADLDNALMQAEPVQGWGRCLRMAKSTCPGNASVVNLVKLHDRLLLNL